MIKGIDLSHWNTVVNYDAMVDYGIRFGCLKLGQGRLKKDPMFDTHRTGFVTRNLPWDLYWFSDYRYSGKDNVTNLISKADGDYGANHPVCDLEFFDGFGPRPDGNHMRWFALDFFGELEAKTSIVGTLYTNRDIIIQMTKNAPTDELGELLRHPLWMATHMPYGNPSPWPKYILNQYELDFSVPWSNSTIDLNDFNGTENEFQTWFYGSVPVLPKTLEERVKRLEDGAEAHGWWVEV